MMISTCLNRLPNPLPVICCLWVLLFSIALFQLPPSLSWAAPQTDHEDQDPDFPLYPSIRPNVDFWVDIFTRYTKSQGVIHDSVRLDIVYDVIDLDDSETRSAWKKNKKIKKAVNEKYKHILLSLARGKTPASKAEKRVARMFGDKAGPEDFKRSASRIRCQTGLKHQFREGLIRSGAVIDEFKKIFISHGLPVDLIYLPCVESSYNFKAYSKFGAAGIWQFTHGTGRQYMEIGYVVDERRDPYISTDAAARLLKKNYSKLGNWPMAMTAYNHGLAGMKRAKARKGSYEAIVASYRSRSFKFASRNFYSEFLAARIVAKNAESYFGRLPYRKPLSFRVVKTRGYLEVDALSKETGTSIARIRELNPALRPPVFNGQKYIPKGFSLKLPETVVPHEIEAKLSALYRDRQKPSRFHRVQKGDTAGSIARLHSVRLNDLILANSLNRRATIYIGQNLRIPVKEEIALAKAEPRIKTPPQKTARPPQPARTKAPEKKAAPPSSIPKETEATLPQGVESLAKPLKEETFVNPNIVVGSLKVMDTKQSGGRLVGTILVEAEETLGHYADWLQIPTHQIRVLNGFRYGTPITLDQRIKLPFSNISVQAFEEKRYEYHKEMEEDFFAFFSVQGTDTHVVKKGDNIWNLCLNELEIPVWLLKKYNPDMNFNSLRPGQKIIYPVVNKKDTDEI